MNHAERERTFTELFQRHKTPLERLCSAYLNSSVEVEDLFQEVMSNVWNALPNFRGESQHSTWLYRIAVNTALLYRRKRKPCEPLPELIDQSAGAQQNLEEQERLAQLRAAIAELPDQDRLIVTLLLEGLSYREISEITGLTVNYVGVKLSRIKNAIEQRLNPSRDREGAVVASEVPNAKL
ncbi:MAG: polymerase, sigma-24 subunit, subfamily [Candidatus Solibacter sp.]|jgi:RNA polymerase sigma factor (sigma-70 family)|nr:polymerase, sigma-24 subunit, subfamily [Candidatus Solibacter sp.]